MRTQAAASSLASHVWGRRLSKPHAPSLSPHRYIILPEEVNRLSYEIEIYIYIYIYIYITWYHIYINSTLGSYFVNSWKSSPAHDDVINWKHFPCYWPLVRGIHRLMFSLICAWINGWVSNRDAGDLRRNRAHYDVIVMTYSPCKSLLLYVCLYINHMIVSFLVCDRYEVSHTLVCVLASII